MPPDTSRYNSTSVDDAEEVPMHESLSQLVEATPFIDLEVCSTNLFDGAFSVVSAIFTSWQREDVKLVQCKDGITNQLVRVIHVPTDFSVLVRAFGRDSEIIIDRKQEIINIVTLSAQGLCPPLYARFKNGLVYGFIKGRVSTIDEMAQPTTASWIAKRLANWHKVRLPQDQDKKTEPKQVLWQTMRRWVTKVPTKFKSLERQQKFDAHFNAERLASELETLIKYLDSLDSPVVFSHNDLLSGNVIYNDEKEEASFIDYEYGCYAFRGFDIGNHFNEYAGFDCDYSKYPEKKYQMRWFEWYLTESNGRKPTEAELEHLYREVEGFSLASHYYWGLWALIQAVISDIDFDYLSYAVLRFDEYDRRKKAIFPSL